MTFGGKNACCVIGNCYNILSFAGTCEWILEVQLIPGLVAC